MGFSHTLKKSLAKLSKNRKSERIIAVPGGEGQIPGGILPETGVGSRVKNREIKNGAVPIGLTMVERYAIHTT